MSTGVGRVKRKPLDPKGNERSESLRIQKGKETGRTEAYGLIVYIRTSGRYYFPFSYYHFAAIGILARRELGEKNS